jgi:hypothetical protein
MLQLKGAPFYATITRLISTASWIEARSADDKGKDQPFHEDTKLGERQRGIVAGRLKDLSEHLDILGARVTLLAIQEAEPTLQRKHLAWGEVKVLFNEISNTLKREMSLVTLLVLEPKEQSYFSQKEPHFGIDVASKFQTLATFEIDEAAKCLALGRHTAGIFHLMRCMEIGR